jgi:hypothetical protein
LRPIGDSADLVSFEFKINLSNSHVKHHFLFAPEIYRGNIYQRDTITSYNRLYSINMACDDSMTETPITHT